MAYRQSVFGSGEFYHIYNRGVEKRTTFSNKRDYQRFLETIGYYQFKNPTVRFSFRNRLIMRTKKDKNNCLLVEIICFCLMPNHFHLLLRQIEEKGITIFLSKLANSYTKYFNTKYQRVGPLFQGTFKAVRIEDDEQLVHVSRYIHLNPLIDYLTKDLKKYQYSSYPEFVGPRDGFCQTQPIIDHFSSPKDYEKFVFDQEEYARTIKNIDRVLLDVE